MAKLARSSGSQPSAGTVTKTRPLTGLGRALGFLTVIPLPAGLHSSSLQGAVPYFPPVGAALGAAAGGLAYGLSPLLSPLPARLLGLLLLVALSGGIHQDGLADLADGLGAGPPASRRIAVMREGAVGAFGVLALLAWALLCAAALAALPRGHLLAAFTGAGALSRFVPAPLATALPPARPEGLGATFCPTRGETSVAFCLTAAAAWFCFGPLGFAAALSLAVALCLGLGVVGLRKLGGQSGDLLGAAVAAMEAVSLLVAAGLWHHP